MISRISRAAQHVVRTLFTEVDVASLVFFRVAFGCCLVYFMFVRYDASLIAELSRPGFHFTYFGFGWVKPLPGAGVYCVILALRVVAIFIAIGFLYRISTVCFTIGYAYIFLIDSTIYHSHPYLLPLLTFILSFAPANRAWSLDAWLSRKVRRESTPAWPVWAIRLQFAAVYFFAGLAKFNYDWLHGEPIRSRLENTTRGMMIDSYIGYTPMCIGGLILDLGVSILLFSPRYRLLAYTFSVLFHVVNANIWRLDIFPYLMIFGTLIFFEPDWPRRVIARINRKPYHQERKALEVPNGLKVGQRVLLLGFTLYFSLQLALPLRHYVYPGNVLWTQEGHTFAWRMMTVWKRGRAEFRVTNPRDGKTWVVDPQEFGANKYGLSMPYSIPFNTLLFAHHIARELERQGVSDVEVRAEVRCSLNGRKPQLLIDPAVDLAAEPLSIRPSHWIMELEEPLPLNADQRLRARDALEQISGTRRRF